MDKTYRDVTAATIIIFMLAACGGSSESGVPLVFDIDGDGVEDGLDAFPQNPSESKDSDNDGIGNNADPDDDNDGVSDDEEVLVGTDPLNSDSDGDAVTDDVDRFPLDATESIDTDNDGIGNNTDTDDDGDGVLDTQDALPLNSSETEDFDGDGFGDNADTDDDNDQLLDTEESVLGTDQFDPDTDGDGVLDGLDDFPTNPSLQTATVDISIVTPSADALVSDNLTVEIITTSAIDISSLELDFSGTVTSFNLTNTLSCSGLTCQSEFQASLDITGFSSGSYIYTVNVTDIDGTVNTQSSRIEINRFPTLSITNPTNNEVFSGVVPINAVCTDTESICTITAEISGVSVSGEGVLDSELDLTSYIGSTVAVKVTAEDANGQKTVENINLAIEDLNNVQLVKAFQYEIIDFNSSKVLELFDNAANDALYISEIISDSREQILFNRDVDIRSGPTSFLTPYGAIFIEQSGSVLTSELFDWNNGALISLGQPNSASFLKTAGDYAIWSQGTTLWKRNLNTQQNVTMNTGAGNWQNDVGENGVVAYWSSSPNYEIIRNVNGIETTLASDVNYWNTYVKTDGSNFIYRKHDACCSNQEYALYFHDGTNETQLTAFSLNEPSYSRDYFINNGWVAYTDEGNLGQKHVWSQSPGLARVQRTSFATSSYIEHLAPNGEMMIINNSKRYLSKIDATITEIGSMNGKAKYINGNWYLSLGNSLYQIIAQ